MKSRLGTMGVQSRVLTEGRVASRPCDERDPDTFQDLQGSAESRESLWLAPELGKVGMGPFGWSIRGQAVPRGFYFLLSTAGSHSRAESRQVVKSRLSLPRSF